MPLSKFPLETTPEANGAFTRITRNNEGEISKLDQYVPEVPENMTWFGIDFATLQLSHPYARLADFSQIAELIEAEASAIAIAVEEVHISAPDGFQVHEAQEDSDSASVTINPEHIIYPQDVFSADGITITQTIGSVRSGATAVAVSVDR